MRGIAFLAWRYLALHRAKTVLLVLSITLMGYVPTGLRVLVGKSADALSARADATPLLVGTKGSALELTLSSLYFESEPPAPTTFAEAQRIADSGLALAIPLHVRFRARGHPIVGTSLEYFELRGLTVEAGRNLARLGECVVGADVAAAENLAPGDYLVSSPESVFDLAGVYPLRMPVVGVLARTGGPDDRAVFCDVKTTWVIEGLGHGHQDVASPEAASAVLERDEQRVVANASLVQYNEITSENEASFHFHGSRATFPVTAVLAVPHDEKSAALLRGRYLDADERSQIVHPAGVMDELLETVFTVQRYVTLALAFVGVSTLIVTGLVFLLSAQLRRREIETMSKIGVARGTIAAILAAEVGLVVLMSLAVAVGLTLALERWGDALLRGLLVS